MSENLIELAIIAFIMVGIGIAIWKGGANNPESTGKLARRIAHVNSDMAALKNEVSSIESRVVEIGKRAATIEDIRRLEAKMDVSASDRDKMSECLRELDQQVHRLREATAAKHASIDHTRAQVDRLYDFIVDRGMSK